MLDTNVFRYKIDTTSQHKREARHFWSKALQELQDQIAEIFTPAEVIRELDVQSYTMKPSEKTKIGVLKQCLVVKPDTTSIQAEHLIRKMSAYVRKNYKPHLDVISRGVEYPAVSDSRILLSAWQHKCIMVTSNIKEFMLYPLLFPAHEDRLYDLLTMQYIRIDPLAHQIINADADFLQMKTDLNRLYSM